MKRLKSLFLILTILLIPSMVFAVAGTSPVTQGKYVIAGTLGDEVRTLIFTCTGDSTDGSIPDKEISTANLNYIKGWYLYRVEAYPTSGGTAPDEADVFILDADGMDLLGSVDGGTTAYNGLSLIHATLKKACLPDLYLTGTTAHVSYYYEVTSKLTLKVANQATHSADYTIVLIFIQEK